MTTYYVKVKMAIQNDDIHHFYNYLPSHIMDIVAKGFNALTFETKEDYNKLVMDLSKEIDKLNNEDRNRFRNHEKAYYIAVLNLTITMLVWAEHKDNFENDFIKPMAKMVEVFEYLHLIATHLHLIGKLDYETLKRNHGIITRLFLDINLEQLVDNHKSQ